jgi:hypothetical protein
MFKRWPVQWKAVWFCPVLSYIILIVSKAYKFLYNKENIYIDGQNCIHFTYINVLNDTSMHHDSRIQE